MTDKQREGYIYIAFDRAQAAGELLAMAERALADGDAKAAAYLLRRAQLSLGSAEACLEPMVKQ